jgi:transcriptional regulator with XRE-family HTH domain
MGRPFRITQSDLAVALGVTRVTVARWTAGRLPAWFPLPGLRRGQGGRLVLSPQGLAVLLECIERRARARREVEARARREVEARARREVEARARRERQKVAEKELWDSQATVEVIRRYILLSGSPRSIGYVISGLASLSPLRRNQRLTAISDALGCMQRGP